MSVDNKKLLALQKDLTSSDKDVVVRAIKEVAEHGSPAIINHLLRATFKSGFQEALVEGKKILFNIKDNGAVNVLLDVLKGDEFIAFKSEIAASIGTNVLTATDMALKFPTIKGAGALPEPQVVGTAFAIPIGNMSQPIVGANGIWVVAPTSIREAAEKSDFLSEQSSGWINKVSKIGEVNRQIAQLDQSDAHAIAALQNERNDLMAGTSFLGKDIQNDLAAQNAEADKFASMSANGKSVLEGQHAVLDGIKKTIQGAVETAIQLYGNLTGAVGGLISGLV